MPYRGSLLGGGFGFVVVRVGLGFGFGFAVVGFGFGEAVVGATVTGADVTGADVVSMTGAGGWYLAGLSSSHALTMPPHRPQSMNAMIPIPQPSAFLRPTQDTLSILQVILPDTFWLSMSVPFSTAF